MSVEKQTNAVSPWIYIVIALVGIVGLLAGLLVSQTTSPKPVIVTTQAQADIPIENGTNPPPPRPDAAQQDIRRIVRNLSPERRRVVLQQAMKNIEVAGHERPRIMMQKRQMARRKTLEIARTEPFDPVAMRQALEDVHKINLEMAKHGTDLTIEVLQLMTPEERNAATQRSPKTRRERIQQRRERRRQRD